MADASANLKAVQAIYEAFGRGDVPAILERLAENVEWEYGGERASGIPWLEARRGRAAVGGFFQAVAENADFEQFQPHTFLTGDNLVVVLCDITFKVKKTGSRVAEQDEVHVWRFDAGGRVARFRHAADTARHVDAYLGPR